MSEAITPEFDRFEQTIPPLQPDLRTVVDTDTTYLPQFSIDDLQYNIGDTTSWLVDTGLTQNKNKFTGYTMLGETTKPNRETLLRGARNVLANFSEYREDAQASSNTLQSQAHKFLNGRRSLNDNKPTVIELTDGGYRQVFGLFLELANDRDPLAYTLAQIHKRFYLSDEDFHNLCLDTMICFQRDRFKALVDAEIKWLRQSAKRAAKAS